MSTNSRKGQLIPRVELRRQKMEARNVGDDVVRNSEPIRAFGDNTLDDTGSWSTNLGTDEIRRMKIQRGFSAVLFLFLFIFNHQIFVFQIKVLFKISLFK